jgi:hypothetical protein
MSEFWIYFQIGLQHVLSFNAYDHILFLVVLTAPYLLKDWKQILILVSVFTIGHTLALLFSVFGIVVLQARTIEFLILLSILITAFFNLISIGVFSKSINPNSILIVTALFGIIHGLGFSNYFNAILTGNEMDKLLPTMSFAIGIEAAQIVIVLSVLTASFLSQHFLKLSKRDWVLITSSLVIGVILPILFKNKIG